MKSVLISIQPCWCELIASGKKTLEVRKTRPKLEVPFKAYIYCTSGTRKNTFNVPVSHDQLVRHYAETGSMECLNCPIGNGKVIGEFICDTIVPISVKYSDPDSKLALREFPWTCLTDKQIIDYLGNGVTGYGWHISDLKIYDRPKELREFHTWKKCNSCRKTGYESTACMYDEDCMVPAVITRAPKSWFYVEEA